LLLLFVAAIALSFPFLAMLPIFRIVTTILAEHKLMLVLNADHLRVRVGNAVLQKVACQVRVQKPLSDPVFGIGMQTHSIDAIAGNPKYGVTPSRVPS